mmetsp:Transcript_68853/g.151759  ORF Transcript_68853/g.151759 Transcript_68853/m.151759 type:complete len:212 (+) Transcript_68853:588-1223(+)
MVKASIGSATSSTKNATVGAAESPRIKLLPPDILEPSKQKTVSVVLRCRQRAVRGNFSGRVSAGSFSAAKKGSDVAWLQQLADTSPPSMHKASGATSTPCIRSKCSWLGKTAAFLPCNGLASFPSASSTSKPWPIVAKLVPSSRERRSTAQASLWSSRVAFNVWGISPPVRNRVVSLNFSPIAMAPCCLFFGSNTSLGTSAGSPCSVTEGT